LRSYEPAPDDNYRFLVLDGSAGECLYLNQKVTWPRLLINFLQRQPPRLKIWVGNGSRSGQNSRDHIFQLKYLPFRALDADTVVILMGVNDLLLRLRRDRHYDPDYLSKPGAAERQLDHAFLFVPYRYSIPPPPFYKKTGLWRAMKRVRDRFFSPRPQDPEGLVIRAWREKRRQASEYRDTLPPMKASLREYVANIEKIISLSSRKNMRLVFLTQPALWKEEMTPEEKARLWMGGVGNFKLKPGSPYYTPAALARGLNLYNRMLKSYCRWRKVECYDLAAEIPPTTEYFYDDCHFTVKGSRRVAEKVSAYLATRPPWKKAGK
jgi:lysophospholipase L1-like esterase